MHELRILTVRQPYASAMFFGLSPKDVENRSKPPPRRMIGGRIYIHAGEALEIDALPMCRELGFDPLMVGERTGTELRQHVRATLRASVTNPMPHGVILGSVLLAGYERGGDSPWRDPAILFGWILRDPEPLERPVCVPGGGSLTHGWRPSEDVAAQILAQEYGRAA